MALPELYKEQEFQRQTFDRNSQFMKHNPNLTARGTRKFNRYWNSDQRLEDEKAFNAAQDAAEVAHIEAEAKKRAESWDARIAALKEQNAARGAAALKSINASLAAKPVVPASKPVAPATPVAKTLTPRSEADWNRIASEATNGQLKTMADVEAWQRANKFSEDQIDGKFGDYSQSYFTKHSMGNYKPAPLDESSPEFIGPVLPPKSDTDSTPQTKPIITEGQFRNSKYFRGVHGMAPNAVITVGGKKYPIMATTGLYGNTMGLTNDHTYAYDPETGKIRKVYENFMGMPFNQFDHGSEWIDPSTLPLFNKQGGKMNRINYFQQGGAAPQQQDVKAQVTALVQAAMQGDQKAAQQVNQIMEAAKAGDQQAIQIAQLMEQVVKELQGQAVAAKYGAKLNYLQSLKCGGKAKKKEQGGKVCPACEQAKQAKKSLISKHQQGSAINYNKAINYYRGWSEDEIRKLKIGLAGYAGYEGDVSSGKADREMVEAVARLQNDKKVTGDGMWGTNSNAAFRLVDWETANRNKGANWKPEQGDHVTYEVSGKKMKENDYYSAINNLKKQFYADPEAFWNAGGETAKWREHLYTTPEGTAIMEEFYSATPDDVREKLGSRVTNRKMQQDQMDSGIRKATDRAAHTAVTKVLPAMGGIVAAPLTLVNPVTAGLAIGGGMAGRKLAGSTAENLVGNDTTTWTSVDGMGNAASVATPTSEIAVPVAEAIGGAAGAAAGAWGSQYVGAPSTQGLAGYRRVNNSAPARTYRSQRRVGGGRFGKRGHYGDGKALDAQVRLNDGTFGYKYQPVTPEYQAYLEGAGGNTSYAVVPIGMRNGGLIPRRK